LYTVEAWKIFLGKLSKNGVFTVSRWYNAKDPSETGRTLSLAVAALMEMGAAAPERHIFLAATGSIATIIVAREPFSTADLAALRSAAAHYQYRVLVAPAMQPESEALRTIARARDREELEAYTSRQAFDLTPPIDDRPFFFNQLPLSRPFEALSMAKGLMGVKGLGGVRAGNLVATATLLVLFLISLVLVVGSIVVPLRSAVKDVGQRLVLGGTMYFLLIGIGFITVEIALLQRMSVFLGHPVYSLSVSLFTLILASGVGSLLSDKLVLDRRWKFVTWGALTGLYILSMRYWLPGLLLGLDSAVLLVRAMTCVAVIAPAGILMGFAFPTGMRLISAVDRRPTPWFWGINGAAGVLASVVAVAMSIAVGINTTLAFGALCYVLLIPAAMLLYAPRQTVTFASPAQHVV
jgi:hypothetical protein